MSGWRGCRVYIELTGIQIAVELAALSISLGLVRFDTTPRVQAAQQIAIAGN
jgi:hypothetical protein